MRNLATCGWCLAPFLNEVLSLNAQECSDSANRKKPHLILNEVLSLNAQESHWFAAHSQALRYPQ